MPIKMRLVDEYQAEPNKVEILKLSSSSMNTYKQCPLKYYYNYIEKAPRKQWVHFDLGNLCHKALEIFHDIYMRKGTNGRSLNKLMKYAFSEARKDYEQLADIILQEAKDLLNDYLKNINKIGMPVVKGVETSFKFNITDDIIIRGFLDRVDVMKDGRFHIVDYKTTKNAKYLKPFQLLIYGLWLKRTYPHIDSFKASYLLLRHDSKLKSYDFNLADIKKCENDILTFAEKINTSIKDDIWTPIPTILCNWCDFQDICPTQDNNLHEGW